MNPPVIAFFNNKGGVGKTSLVYHLAWMAERLGLSVVAADLDPQANLTSSFLDEDDLEKAWTGKTGELNRGSTIAQILDPLVRGTGDILTPELIRVSERVSLLAGDLALSGFEDELSQAWPNSSDGKERGFRVTTAFWRTLVTAAESHSADVVLVDVGPSLGALNRSALVAADYVVIPLAADLFSVRALHNLGPTLRTWREEWQGRLVKAPADLTAPGRMEPLGYVVLQHSVRLDRPAKAYERWLRRIPAEYRSSVLHLDDPAPDTVDQDDNLLGQVRHHRSLIPLAQDARKPVFDLKPADGAFGGHQGAVQQAAEEFRRLATAVFEAADVALPTPV
ncbi:MAG: ParA family protein [Dermatophilaceae bacterium]